MGHYDDAYDEEYSRQWAQEKASKIAHSTTALQKIGQYRKDLLTAYNRFGSPISVPQYVQDALAVIENYHAKVLYDLTIG